MAARLEETIKNFYEKNHIKSELYTDSMEEAYTSNKRYDKKIALPSLQKRVEAWIRFFEKEDQEYFLRLLESFTYITKETLAYRIYNLCSSLFKNLLEKGIDYSEILFVVIESPAGIKSGADEMAVNVWNINQEFEITKKQIITAYSKVDQKLVEEARAHPEKTFSMGFRQCKLLLAFHYETPNNTLCSFWKATDKNQPVFARSGYTRLSLDRIRKQKIHMRENAYLYQSIHQGGNK